MNVPTTPDTQQLDRLRAGDHAACAGLVHECGPRMLAVARRMLANEEDAQDAVQDAFAAAFKALPQFDGRAALPTWLHRILINTCLMKLRTRRRRPERSIETLLPTFIEDGHQTRSTAHWSIAKVQSMARAEHAAHIRAAIDELPDIYRVVLILRDVEELSTSEAAQALSITQAAVKVRLHRARQALRTLLEPLIQSMEQS